MGNKLCKKKVDVVDNPNLSSKSKSPTPFDRIINRLHLRPNAWKSDSHLDQKETQSYDVNPTNPNDNVNIIRSQPLSKSSDWTEVDLEVPDKEDHVHLRNPKLSIIFNHENGTPTPPPRKHKKNFREKIEAVAKTGLQAFQSKKSVEETVCVKKKINYNCPICDQDEREHNRDHHHHHNHTLIDNNKNESKKEDTQGTATITDKKSNKEEKRRKNLSVVSLPNYNELKLTVANFEDIDKATDVDKSNNSMMSLPGESKKITAGSTGSTGKLDNYITRCRSFGSLLPQQLKKFKTRKAPADIESDDSFGGLEDWDLGLIEHYNPKDASLPRPRKIQRNSKDIVSDIESLVVKEEDVEKPKPPARHSESLVKKINREASETAHKRSKQVLNEDQKLDRASSPTPPPSPVPKPQERLFLSNLPTEENGKVEHSSLMKILEQFSIQDKQEAVDSPVQDVKSDENSTKNNSNQSSLTPSLLEFEKNIAVNSLDEFINAEKKNTEKDLNFGKYNPTIIS